MARLGVVLPVYNGALYIRESVESILKQSFQDFILYVIDDGSTDRTVEILTKIEDSRLQILLNEQNRGLIYSLNKGLKHASSCQYVARMDADDISHPDRFEKQVNFLELHAEVGVLGTGMRFFSEATFKKRSVYKPTKNAEILSSFLFYNSMFHPTVMIRSSVLKNDEKYPEEFPKYEDYAFWIQLTNKTTFSNISEILLDYRRHDSNITNTYVQNIENDLAVHGKLISEFCHMWHISLTHEEIRTLGLIGSRERYGISPSQTVTGLIASMESIATKLPLAFDKKYFRTIFCERSLLYFARQKKFIQVVNFLFRYKYDKIFLIRFALFGKDK